jgi:hypothetical protein
MEDQPMMMEDPRKGVISPGGAQMMSAEDFDNQRQDAMSPPSHQNPKMMQEPPIQ